MNEFDFDITQNEHIPPAELRALSSRQFNALSRVINTGGGFSVKAIGSSAEEPAGRRATSGYMVGMPGRGQDLSIGAVSGADIEGYVTAKTDLLSKPGMYLGGWQGQDPVRASVDIAKRFPRGKRGGLTGAKALAARSNQEAIGVVGPTAGYEGEVMNPNYNPERGHSERPLSVKDAEWIAPRTPAGQPKAPSSRQAKIRKK